jgi:predicted O-linked N-acetylglucosamine transferase (SPINDLY family)
VATPLALLAVSDSAPDKLRCSQILMQDKYPPREPLWRGEIYRHDRVRVAYLSADLRTHPVGILMAGVFEHHDRTRFQTVAIAHGLDDGSEMRSRLKRTFDRFVDVQGKSDRDVASLLRALEIDIAVDLTSLTANARPGILAFRPAPVQVNYLGFAGSMGAPFVDYILADRIVLPYEHQSFYSERVAYLPDSYMPHDSQRAISADIPSRSALGLPETGFVFASFNNSYKFTAPMFDIWMRLLRAVEGSVLWLPSANPTAMRNLQREAEARGVSPERIVFAPHLPAAEDHLARLRAADLFLDTLPYNAHSTAMDALWAGLPILTVKGQSFASRVAASLLTAAGLPELIAESLDAYEALALDLARNPTSLAALREKLRDRRDNCALFDTARFTRNLEAALGMMWERTQRGEPPATFSVGDSTRAFP